MARKISSTTAGSCAVLSLCLSFLGASAASAGSLPSFECTTPGSTATPSNNGVLNANSCTDFSYSMTQNANNWQYGYYSVQNNTPSTFLNMNPVAGQGFWAVDFTKYWTSQDAFGAHPNSYNTNLHAAPYCITNVNCGSGPDTPTTNPTGFQNGVDTYHVEQWAVRQYDITSNYTDVSVNITAEHDPGNAGPNGNGTEILVYLIRNNIRSLLDTLIVPYDPTNPVNGSPVETLDIGNLSLLAGDKLDFALAPLPNPHICAVVGQQNCIAADPNDPGTHTADYNSATFELITITTPEPGTLMMLGSGLLLFGAARLRRRRS